MAGKDKVVAGALKNKLQATIGGMLPKPLARRCIAKTSNLSQTRTDDFG